MEEETYHEKVYRITRQIPRGKVSTYGAISDYLALGSARMVGWALNQLHGDASVPAHRVVNRKGELSGRTHFENPDAMASALQMESIEVEDFKIVNLKKYLWHPSELDTLESKSTSLIAESLGDLRKIAEALVTFAGDRKIILFKGGLGAGKTTFIKILTEVLGSEDEVSSPTFSLVNEYSGKAGKIYHMDLYRVEKEDDLVHFGFDEYLDSGQYCFIEWPQVAESHFDAGVIVEISVDAHGNRGFSFEVF